MIFSNGNNTANDMVPTQIPQNPQSTQIPQDPQNTQIPQDPQMTQVPQPTSIPTSIINL